MVRRGVVASLAISAIAIACKPTLDDTTSIVSTARVLAVRAEPAEAAPKADVKLTALVADANGTVTNAPLDWAFCDLRKPLAELGPVSSYCMVRDADYLREIGAGSTVTTTVSETACREFGPDVPQAKMGEPAGRPVDPDLTGGYYTPLRLALSGASGDALTLERERIACGLAGATSEQLVDYKKRYRPNVNPEIDSLASEGAPVPLEGAGAATVAAGARVTLRASWATCDPTKECTGSETYAVFDVTTRALVDKREAMRVAWFATGGAFDRDNTGRDEGDDAAFSENGWKAPSAPGTVHLWVVVRDDRGGAGWRAYTFDVR